MVLLLMNTYQHTYYLNYHVKKWWGLDKAGERDASSQAKQNNIMMASCLSQLLTTDATARLLIARHKYTFDGV